MADILDLPGLLRRHQRPGRAIARPGVLVLAATLALAGCHPDTAETPPPSLVPITVPGWASDQLLPQSYEDGAALQAAIQDYLAECFTLNGFPSRVVRSGMSLPEWLAGLPSALLRELSLSQLIEPGPDLGPMIAGFESELGVRIAVYDLTRPEPERPEAHLCRRVQPVFCQGE